MANLFNIQSEYIVLMQQLMENGGEVTPELQEALEINQQQLQEKAANYCVVIRNLESESEIIANEIKRLQELKKVRENAANRLKETISKAMELYEVEKIETPLTKLSFRKSESVEITDLELIPHEYQKVKVEADKTAIKAAIKSGANVPGAKLMTNKNLQIR